MKKMSMIVGLILIVSIVIIYQLKNDHVETKPESIHVEAVNIKTSITEDFKAILGEVRMSPSEVNNQDCFQITEIMSGSKFEETQLLKNDCLVQITSYKWDPQTVTPSKVPEVVILNSASQMSKLESALTAPYTVELILFRNQKKIQLNYKIDITM